MLAGILIILLVLPVLFLLLVLGALAVIFFVIISAFRKKRPAAVIEREANELLLISTDKVTIFIVQDDKDAEYANAAYEWQEAVDHRVVSVYRASTNPHIPALDQKFVTSFNKETPKGAFLQMVEGVNSKLVFLDYDSLQVSFVTDVGPYDLYDDPENDWRIRGINYHNEITLSITQPGH